MTLIMCSKMIFVHEPFTTYGTGEFEYSFVEAFMEFEIIGTAKFLSTPWIQTYNCYRRSFTLKM